MGYARLEAAGLIQGTEEHRERYEEKEYNRILLERIKEQIKENEKEKK